MAGPYQIRRASAAVGGRRDGYASRRTDANVGPSSPTRASQWITGMTDASENFEPSDDDVLAFDAPDAALEAAASALIRGAAFSFPNSPTVSVVFQCCGND
jgi:hypothetical protein